MGNNVQLNIFGGEVVSKGTQTLYRRRMNDGVMQYIEAKPLNSEFHYHKEHNRYWLTKTSSGILITSARTIKLLKELIQEPEFFDKQLTPRRLADAVERWGNKHYWKV